MEQNERDMHFQSFASLLWQEIMQSEQIGHLPVFRLSNNAVLQIEKVIAQRAYDLVKQSVETVIYDKRRYDVDDTISDIPDMTAWPEEGK